MVGVAEERIVVVAAWAGDWAILREEHSDDPDGRRQAWQAG